MKRNWIIGISAAVAGLLLLISPKFCVKIILVLFGLTAVIEGFYGLVSERKLFDNDFYQKTTLYKSIGNIIIGLLAVVMPITLAGTAWAVMTFILAIYLILSGLAGFIATSKLKVSNASEDGKEVSKETATEGKQLKLVNIVTLASGILLLVIGPETLGSMILRIIGLVALLVGAGFILVQVIEHKKEIKVTEVEVTDYQPSTDEE